MKYLTIIILLFATFLSTDIKALTSDDEGIKKNPLEDIFPQSPQAKALARYGEYPVSYATGVPKINIPIYDIKLGNLTLPISLSYHASGIKKNDVASTVGLGWVLNAGGVITRTVNGALDLGAYWTQKYYDSQTIAQMLRFNGSTQERFAKQQTFCDFHNNRLEADKDMESDRYTFNFAGKTGVFYYSYKDKEFICLNYDNMYIYGCPDTSNGTYDSYFIIVDTNGYEYYFDQPEFIGTKTEENRMDISAWYLTKIRTPYGEVNFSYVMSKEFDLVFRSDEVQTGKFIFQEIEEYEDDFHLLYEHGNTPITIKSTEEKIVDRKDVFRIKKTFRIPVLSSISWNDNRIIFSYENDRKDIWETRLCKIDVINSAKDTIKSAILDNNHYWGNITSNPSRYIHSTNYRMLLKGIKLSDCGNYSFSYNNVDKEYLPIYMTTEGIEHHFSNEFSLSDYWGYYNGKKAKTLIPKEAYNYIIDKFKAKAQNKHIVYVYDHIRDYADRSPSEYYMQLGIISQITYPTGGKSVFKFESNKSENSIIGGLRVSSITSYDKDNKKLNAKKFEYSNATLLCDNPIESMVYKSYISTDFYIDHGYGVGIWKDVDFEPAYTCSSTPLTALTNTAGICYGKVRETNDDGTYCEYIYTPYGDIAYGNYVKGYTYKGEEFFCEPPFVNDLGTLTPTLIKKCYFDANNNLLLKEEFFYQNYEKMFDIGTKMIQNVIHYNSIDWDFKSKDLVPSMIPIPLTSIHYSNVIAHSNVQKLISKCTTDANGVKITEDYTYDSDLRTNLPKTKSVTNSDGHVYKTEYIYPFESDDPKIREMAETWGLFDEIICTNNYCDDVITNSVKTDYKFINNWYYPYRKSISYQGGDYIEKYRIEEFGNKGNIKKIISNNIDMETIEWDKTETYPLVHKKNGHIMAKYKWKPLVGVTSITKENGYTINYEYDKSNRLKSTSDESGIIEQYKYNVINK